MEIWTERQWLFKVSLELTDGERIALIALLRDGREAQAPGMASYVTSTRDKVRDSLIARLEAVAK